MWWTLPFLVCLQPGLRTGDPRPELSGPEEIFESSDGRYALHYTLDGVDAVGGDLANDGIPEIVHEAAEALVDAEQTYLDRGYRALIGDDGTGGSTAIDVYVRDIDANGYAHPILDGSDGATCFMQLDHELTIPGVMRSVAIHELHHCVEYRYTTGAHSWIYEATATFEQYRTFLEPALEAAVVVLWQRRLDEPQQPMAFTDGQYEYAGMVSMLFFEQFDGVDAARIPDLWEALAVDPDWQIAFDAEARRVFGLSWDELFLEYATWNAFACANDDGGHYDPGFLPCNDVVGVPLKGLEWDGRQVWFEVKLPQTSHNARYFEIDDAFPDLEVALQCGAPGQDGARLWNRIAHVEAGGTRGVDDAAPAEEEAVLPAGRPAGGSIRVIAASVGDEAAKPECRLFAREPEEAKACGCRSSGSAALWAWLPLLVAVRRRQTEPHRAGETTAQRGTIQDEGGKCGSHSRR